MYSNDFYNPASQSRKMVQIGTRRLLQKEKTVERRIKLLQEITNCFRIGANLEEGKNCCTGKKNQTVREGISFQKLDKLLQK